MINPPHPRDPWVEHWLKRHRDPVSIGLHLVGIPLTILAVLLIPIYLTLLSMPVFLFSASLFFGGYALQFLGHAIEGTDPGEIIPLKRWLGWSYHEYPDPNRRRGRRRAAASSGNASQPMTGSKDDAANDSPSN